MPGPRPRPVEQKRLNGRSPGRDSGGRKLPDATVVALPGAGERTPPVPGHLVPEGVGAARWERLWREAGAWLSVATDIDVVTRLCELEDLRDAMHAQLAQDGLMVKGSTGQSRTHPLIDKIRALDEQLLKYERECGLTPSARGSLGVGEVTAAESKLEAVMRNHARRGQAAG